MIKTISKKRFAELPLDKKIEILNKRNKGEIEIVEIENKDIKDFFGGIFK